MVRGMIELKKIESPNSRQLTFSKRQAGLLKKAKELSILCDIEVAVIIFSTTGEIAEFASSSMDQILARYQKCIEKTPIPALEHKPEEPKAMDDLKEEVTSLKVEQQRLLGKDLTGTCLQELRSLEQELNEGLLCIKEKKEQILMQQLAQSRLREQQAMLENKTLRRQIEELRDFSPSASHNMPLSTGYPNGAVEAEVSLQLGLPSAGVYRKRKTPGGEIQSSNSENQIGQQRSSSCEYPPAL